MEKQSIALYGNTSQIMNDAIDRIVVGIYNKRTEKKGARKILFTGCGPQCGNTSTCIGLGISFAAAKWRTLIVDCDLRKANDLKKLNQNTNIGLSDYLLDETIGESFDFEKITYTTNFDHLSFIPSGKYAANPARLFCSGMMKQFLTYVGENYDYVLFDFPSVSVSPDAEILFADVDGIVLISAMEEVTKRQIRDAKHKVEPFADKYYGMIINKIDHAQYKKYIQRYDYYFIDKNGNQKLNGTIAKKYRMKNQGKKEEK